MKTQDLLIYGGLGYLTYRLFFKDKPAPSQTTQGAQIDTPMMDASQVGLNNTYHFKYVGMSALRVDENGQEIYCGIPGEPFSVAGIEGSSATVGSAPTTFYALLELGDEKSVNEGYSIPGANAGARHIKTGDTLDLTITGGQFSALDNQRVTVLQLGTDKCTPSGKAEGKRNLFVVDVPIILEGAQDSQYPAQEGVGYATKVNF
jgi:hypothetical protein